MQHALKRCQQRLDPGQGKSAQDKRLRTELLNAGGLLQVVFVEQVQRHGGSERLAHFDVGNGFFFAVNFFKRCAGFFL